jgi:hypothetical protein
MVGFGIVAGVSAGAVLKDLSLIMAQWNQNTGEWRKRGRRRRRRESEDGGKKER